MPRVHAPNEKDVILKNMREYAILKELDVKGDGNISSEELVKLAARYGDKEKASKLAEDATFEDFSAAFRKVGEEVEGEGNCIGWAARDTSGKLSPWKFTRRDCKPDDVNIKITYAGMCHSDIHTIRGEWSENQPYPMVPGHEIIGVVVEVGSKVTKVKVGDFAGVGCCVNSCRTCKQCSKDEEQYCKDMIMTYSGKDVDGTITQGGYSTNVVVTEHFVLNLPAALHVPGGAPLLCAGITTYSPMKYYGVDKPGMKIGVVGLGGLGHMAVKLGKAFGQHVTVISRSDAKKSDAMDSLGADAFLVSKDAEAMKAAAGSFDAVIDTVSANHDIGEILSLLDVDGTLILLGVPPASYSLSPAQLLFRRLKVGGSLVGGIKETQEMLDFCAEKGVLSDIELVNADYANTAIERMSDGDVKYRFVIDVQGSLLMDK